MSDLRPYHELEALGGYYLEANWVRAFRVGEREAEFDLQAVLTEIHADYGPPARRWLGIAFADRCFVRHPARTKG